MSFHSLCLPLGPNIRLMLYFHPARYSFWTYQDLDIVDSPYTNSLLPSVPAHRPVRLPISPYACPCARAPPHHSLCLPMCPCASPSLPVPAHGPMRLPITPCACPWSRAPPHHSLCLPMCTYASPSLPAPAHGPVRLSITPCAYPKISN